MRILGNYNNQNFYLKIYLHKGMIKERITKERD